MSGSPPSQTTELTGYHSISLQTDTMADILSLSLLVIHFIDFDHGKLGNLQE